MKHAFSNVMETVDDHHGPGLTFPNILSYEH